MSFDEPSHLLFRVKLCVEFELNQNSSRFPAPGGAKNSLRDCLVVILNHGLIQRNNSIGTDVELSSPLLQYLISVFNKFHPGQNKDNSISSVATWVNYCIVEKACADHFKLFLADKSILLSIYTNDAFLLSVPYSDALVLCLQALELNRPEFLAEIDPILFLSISQTVPHSCVSTPILHHNTPEIHRSTFSVVSQGNRNPAVNCPKFSTPKSAEMNKDLVGISHQESSDSRANDSNFCDKESYSCYRDFNSCDKDSISRDKDSRCKDDCIEEVLSEILAQVCTIEENSTNNPQTTKPGHRRTVSDFVLDKTTGVASEVDNSIIHTRNGQTLNNSLRSDRVNTTTERNIGHREFESRDFDWLKKSLETTQQTLVDARLRDLEISIELERENTHFYLSEMLIAAVEQMKWNQQITSGIGLRGFMPSGVGEPHHLSANRPSHHRIHSSTSGLGQSNLGSLPGSLVDIHSDSEYPFSEVSLSELNDREIPSSLEIDSEIRRRHYAEAPSTSSSYYVDESLPSRSTRYSRSDTPTTSRSINSPPNNGYFPGTADDSIWDDDGSDEMRPMVEAGTIARDNRPSLEDKERGSSHVSSSAEEVAASLLRYFSEKIRPTAAQMEWLVSYRDAPQLILPLPSSSPVMPDEIFSMNGQTLSKVRLRGTHDWAPPRPQVIFKLHPPPKLKPLLAAQNYRCAGCGLKLDKSVYQKRVRYCEYLGRFFCQVCHRGSQTQIPSRIIHKWDFRLFPVSDFGHRFLTEHANTPMFNVAVINKKIFEQVKPMRYLREQRKQLRIMWDYIRTCRVAADVVTKEGKLKQLFLNLPPHFLQEVDVYALADFTRVKDGTLEKAVETVLLMGRTHIQGCQHCKAQGFLCELCKSREVLFPFQVDSVYQCKLCGVCNHLKCCKKNKFQCPKCLRIKERKKNEEALAALVRATRNEISPIVETGGESNPGDPREPVIDYSASVVLN